jgi:hypothetical protein
MTCASALLRAVARHWRMLCHCSMLYAAGKPTAATGRSYSRDSPCCKLAPAGLHCVLIIIIIPCKPYLSASATAPHPLGRRKVELTLCPKAAYGAAAASCIPQCYKSTCAFSRARPLLTRTTLYARLSPCALMLIWPFLVPSDNAVRSHTVGTWQA